MLVWVSGWRNWHKGKVSVANLLDGVQKPQDVHCMCARVVMF
jgi:hypothetical protein